MMRSDNKVQRTETSEQLVVIFRCAAPYHHLIDFFYKYPPALPRRQTGVEAGFAALPLSEKEGHSFYSDGAVLDNILYRNNRFERNYPDLQQKAIHIVVSKRNPDSKLGEIKNVLIQNCSFENIFPKNSLIKYEGEGTGIQMIIDNLVIAGKKVNSAQEAGIESVNANVLFRK
jgi:hypothetical protein